jgi:hypothetical protein
MKTDMTSTRDRKRDKALKAFAKAGALPGAVFRDSATYGTFRTGRKKMSKKERRLGK